MGWSDTRVIRRCQKCLSDKPAAGGMMVGTRRGRGGMAAAAFVCLDCVRAHAIKHARAAQEAPHAHG